MAGTNRTPPHLVKLVDQLQQDPYAFDFFQAIRLLDCAAPDTPQTGHSETPKDDPFRLAQEPSAAFAPATLTGMEAADEYHPLRVVQRFMGLLGPQGPLPMHLTDYAYSRIHHHRDYTFSRFLDVFHHRMVALFYRAWARVRPTVNFDHGSKDRFGEYVAALFGLGMPSLECRDALPDLVKRHFAGLLSCQTKHADGLLAMLQAYFCLPVEIEQFVGQWIDLPTDCRCLMGSSPAISKLGETITVGAQIWDCQQKFRIVMGPLSLAEYYHFLPGETGPLGATDNGDELSESESEQPISLEKLVALVRSYIGDELQWDVQLILKEDEIPPVSMGMQGHLGWSSWLIREPMKEQAGDLILDAVAATAGKKSPKKPQYRNIPAWGPGTLGQHPDGTLVGSPEGEDGVV